MKKAANRLVCHPVDEVKGDFNLIMPDSADLF